MHSSELAAHRTEKTTSYYPRWVARRLRVLDRCFATGEAELNIKHVRTSYASFSGSDGRQLQQRHLESIGRAWMVVGPHVQSPPIEIVPAIIRVVDLMDEEDPLLKGWLLLLFGNQLRTCQWVGGSGGCVVETLLRCGVIRNYWNWLMGAVKHHCIDDGSDPDSWHNEVMASRVITSLFHQAGLNGLVHRSWAWHSAPVPSGIDRMARAQGALPSPSPSPSPSQYTQAILDDPNGVVRNGVQILHLRTAESLRREAIEMDNCVAELEKEVNARQLLLFSLVDLYEDERATAALELDNTGCWRVLQIEGAGNHELHSMHQWELTTFWLCAELDEIGPKHELLDEYLKAGSSEARKKQWDTRIASSRLQMRRYVPGIGNHDPGEVFRACWTKHQNS